ncbi:MAG: 50S ribosomal protein L18 [Deltaproteobacteria bacterium]|nr:50S ribosomal protein L18 [Deltaproteobacteria bacterium]
MARESRKQAAQEKRSRRVRHSIKGGGNHPRLTVFRSHRHIAAQIVDDRNGVTLVAASTLDKGFRRKTGQPFDKDLARAVGRRIAERAKEKNIHKVVFDRGPYLYHGKVKALADGAREGGLDF